MLRAGPGRAGPGHSFHGPGLIIQFAGQARAGTLPVMRALASNNICGPGLGPKFRPVQDTSTLGSGADEENVMTVLTTPSLRDTVRQTPSNME